MALERETVHLQDPEHPFAVDGRFAFRPEQPVQEGCQAAIAIGRPLIDQPADDGQERGILRLAVGAASRRPGWALNQVGAGDAQCLGNSLHGVSPSRLLHEASGKIGFFARARSSASLRISASMVLRPSKRSRSRTRFSSSRILLVPTTSSSAWTAWRPPSSIRRFQAKSWLGAMPARRATNETDMPSCMVSSTKRTFSAVDQRRRRCTDVMTSTRGGGANGSDDIVVFIGGCLCLIELCHLSGQNGVRSSRLVGLRVDLPSNGWTPLIRSGGGEKGV